MKGYVWLTVINVDTRFSESVLGIASVIESSICLKNVGKRYAVIERILIERRKSKSLVIAPAVT